jgi:hypothetical protein
MEARIWIVLFASLVALAGCDGRALLGPPTVSGDAAVDLGVQDAGGDSGSDAASDIAAFDAPGGDVPADGGLTCGADETRCGDACVDTRSDPRNCGVCASACAAAQVCNAGVCTTACGAGLSNCASACVDLGSSNDHCGACGVACTGGTTCSAGTCVCPAGTTRCGSWH